MMDEMYSIINHKQDDVLEFDSRNDSILDHIKKNPGIRHRELLRLSSYPNGVLTYHLLVLERGNKVRVDRKRNKITRYYLVDIPTEDSDIISCLRNKVTRGLIIFMIYHDQCTFSELVESSGKAPSTISWHLKWLKKAGIVSALVGEGRHLYGVVNSMEVKKILWSYKEAFTDNVVENYVEMIDKL